MPDEPVKTYFILHLYIWQPYVQVPFQLSRPQFIWTLRGGVFIIIKGLL